MPRTHVRWSGDWRSMSRYKGQKAIQAPDSAGRGLGGRGVWPAALMAGAKRFSGARGAVEGVSMARHHRWRRVHREQDDAPHVAMSHRVLDRRHATHARGLGPGGAIMSRM